MHRYTLLLIDLLIVAASTIGALILRDNLEVSTDRVLDVLPYLLLTVLAAVPVLLLVGANRTLWRFSSPIDVARVVVGVLVIVLLAMALAFIFNRLENVSRALPILQAMLMATALGGIRVAMRVRHARRSRARKPTPDYETRQENVLLVGVNPISELFLRSVEEYAPGRVKVFGILGPSERHRGRVLRSCPILGTPEELEKVLGNLEVHGVPISRIVITARFDKLSATAQAILLRVEQTSNIVLDIFAERVVFNGTGRRDADADLSDPPSEKRRARDIPLVVDPGIRPPEHYLRWKRALDATAAGLAILAAAPLMLFVSILVALDTGLPTIFWQQRPGLRGWPFRLYKFRTMGAPHDRSGGRLSEAERHSSIGRFLRRTRLDELPQLYNILVGDMSFVGPRPLLPVDQSPAFAARLAIRPGLTGWAQIKGGRELTVADKAALDIWYVRNASLWLDLRILLGTLGMIRHGERADRAAIRQAWRELTSPGRNPVQDKTLDDNSSHLHKASRGEYARDFSA